MKEVRSARGVRLITHGTAIRVAVLLTLIFLTSCKQKTIADNETAGPVHANMDSLQVFQDITYKTVNGKPFQLDIYRASGQTPALLPVVIYIHGGGWASGDKNSVKKPYRWALLKALCKSGFAVVSINYRLTDSLTIHFPAPVADCKDAVRWLRKNASLYHFDADNIGLWGTSAGAHLALLTAYTNVSDFKDAAELSAYPAKVRYVLDNYGPTDLQKLLRPDLNTLLLWYLKSFEPQKFEKRRSRLQTFTGLDPAVEKKRITELCQKYSPVAYVGKSTVPTLIFHGGDDATVPDAQSKLLNDALSKCGVPHQLVIYPGETHGFEHLSAENTRDLIEKSITFIRSLQTPVQ